MYEHDREWIKQERVGEQASIWYPKADRSLESSMKQYLEGRELNYKLAKGYAWYAAEHHGPRIIIPCQRTDRKNFWQGRLIEGQWEGWKNEFKRWDSPHGPRGDAICFLENDKSNHATVMEGPMCALAAAEFGFAAIATLGLGVNGPVLAHVSLAVGSRKCLLIPDRDSFAKWIKIQTALGTMGLRTVLLDPSPYKDLADMPKDYRKEKLEWAKSQ